MRDPRVQRARQDLLAPPGPLDPRDLAARQEAEGKDAAVADIQIGSDYVGSAACGECHQKTFDTFMKSGHPWKLNKVVDGKPPAYPFTALPNPPEGYTWNDVSDVIGGYNWKARFMDKNGYIITDKPGATVSDTNYLNQYNYANPVVGKEAGWVKYNSGVKELKYTCGTCHTTGYSAYPPDSHQDGMPGIVGTWTEPGIQCEACHGPGSQHVADPSGVQMVVDRSGTLCGKCHRRDTVEAVNAKDGFIEHHEQYEELFQSKHVVIDCVICHDPHTGVVQLREAKKDDPNVKTTRTACANCHFKEEQNQKNEMHAQLDCMQCHMPRITKTAWGDAKKFTGDIRTHLMAIDPNQIAQFSEDGKTALSQLGLDFACRHCHVPDGPLAKTDDQLKAMAKGYHAAK